MTPIQGQLSLATDGPAPAPEAPLVTATEDFALTAEQAAAIEARGGDAFMEAGAGTGKTTVLVDRYCAAVDEDEVEVERVLAFTFTDRAAAEMRARVRRELLARARDAGTRGDDLRADRLRTAARASERGWVMTIHAFCRRLLASHPLAAGLDPRFRVLDAAEANRLCDRAVNDALDELLAEGDEDVARAASAYQAWRITAMTIGAHERLRSQGMAEPRLPEVSEPVHSPGRNEEQRPLTPEEMEAALSARAALERLLEGFHSRYEQLKEERSALDFQDLELRALALLRESPAIAESWRGRFEHVMVDEFQDTNRVQLGLIEALRGPETKVFMVGDENQSIYRFRNADLEVFREQREAARVSGDCEVLPLRGNFRSLPAVLAAVNEVGRTLLDGFKELTAGRAADTGPGEIELLLTLDERGKGGRRWDAEEIELDPPATGSGARIVAEARFLAQRLRALVDAGEAERGEIVVLLRAFTHVDAYEEALRRAGMRPFVVGGRGYWTQQQVEDLARLLGVLANPLDDERLFGALASFAAGVSPDALWLLRHAARNEEDRPRHVWPVLHWRYGDGPEPNAAQPDWLESIPAEDVARLERFCRIVAGLRAEAPLLSLEELIERTMSAFGYDLGLIAREGGPGRMANVRKLMRLAREYERNERRDLAGFLALAASSTRRDEREGMAAVQAEGHDGVRVMTVHAAKGLEFPVVAVPDLGRDLDAGHWHEDLRIGRAPADADGPPRFGMRLTFPAEKSFGLWELTQLNQEESAAEAQEGCRLIYVAASRARDRLILSGLYRPDELDPAEERKPNDTALRRLLPALAAHGWTGGEGSVTLPGAISVDGSTELPDAELRVRLSEPGPQRALELVRTLPPPPEPDPFERLGDPPPLLDPRQSAVPVGHLSYSTLALYERCGYRFYVERVLGAREGLSPAVSADSADDGEEPETADELVEPGVSRSHALGIGNAVHAALEWSARRGWQEPPEPLLQTLLAREGVGDGDDALGWARRLVSGWLEAPLRAELETTTLRPELPFVLALGETVVRGQIDLLATSADAIATVVDYKTDALDGRSPLELAERYRAQREIYALAASGGAEVRVAHVFLEAPNEPVVEVLGPAELDAANARLEGVVERMRGGDFEVTETPYAALCFGCPAAARLCPRPAWKPSRP